MIRFGVEHLFSDHLDSIREEFGANPQNRGSPSIFEDQQRLVEFLRCFPDFLAIRKEKGSNGVREIFPVEVKFRTEREFYHRSNPKRSMVAIRFSMDSILLYQKYWPSTLVVVFCYHSGTLIATRVSKLNRTTDSRVPIQGSSRRSWFFDITRQGFLPLWKFKQGYYDEARCQEAMAEIQGQAQEIQERQLWVNEDAPLSKDTAFSRWFQE